ncbi:hypothetical protein K504DRAFT_236628 [Pleomassaria siparia CBS 279.74]|uniref:Uncharacterized protein n=1 Tax=Pleomassaria siparia CBS 279.74 TaxID=1314801 RepID=A0A6G1KDC4_9PLEO|nr:hypothetical protein K504DRAFT_236628 [Pleomassaria siparia CBS 279.74]
MYIHRDADCDALFFVSEIMFISSRFVKFWSFVVDEIYMVCLTELVGWLSVIFT